MWAPERVFCLPKGSGDWRSVQRYPSPQLLKNVGPSGALNFSHSDLSMSHTALVQIYWGAGPGPPKSEVLRSFK